MIITYFKLIVILFLTTFLFGQKNDHVCINFNFQNGINDNQTTGITQDSRGFYWISTVNGWSRFDGSFFKNYYPSELLGEETFINNSKVYFESKPNQIIITLGNSQVYLLDCITQKLKIISGFEKRNSFDFYRLGVNKIAVSCVDTIFIVNNNFKILQSIVPPSKQKGSGVFLKELDKDNYLISNGFEMFVYTVFTAQFKSFHHEINHEKIENSTYNLLYVDTKKKSIFVSNYFLGLYKLDYSGNVLYHWTGAHPFPITLSPNKIIPDPNNGNVIWMTGNTGVTKIDLSTNQTFNYVTDPKNTMSIAGNYCNNLFFDGNKQLWVTTNNGLSSFNKLSNQIQLWDLKLSDEEPIIQLLKTKDETLYATKYYSDVYQIKSKGIITNAAHPFLPKVLLDSWFTIEADDDLIHGGKGNELTYVQQSTGKIKKSKLLVPYFKESTVITLAYKANNGDLWFSGNAAGGLVQVTSISNEIHHFSKAKGSFSGSYYTRLTEDLHGDLWFCSNKSQILAHWKKKSNTFQEIDFSKILKKMNQTVIQCVASDRKGNIWVGFEGGGLLKFNPTSRQTKVFGENQGLPSNYIYSITIDSKNRLWLGTKKGMACMFEDEKTIRLFNEENGFPSSKFESAALFDAENSIIWIASEAHLLSFNPDKILNKQQARLSVFVDEFSVNNKFRSYKVKEVLALNSLENNIYIRFVALNFSKASKVVYSYQLLGSSSNWVTIGQTDRITLLNLKYGAYIFKLRAKILGSDQWVYLEEPIQFEIATPWYQTWWFFILLSTLFTAFIYFLTRFYFIKKVEVQNAKLEKQKAIQNERDRIAFDMHDDLGSGLTKISYLSQIALSKSTTRDELLKINETSLELVSNMSELIWTMKVENDSLQDLLNYLKRYAVDYFETNSLQIQVYMPTIVEDIQISGDLRRNILLIVKEGFHNIVKHSKAKSVKFSMEYSTWLIIVIDDDGIGFDTAIKSDGNGMSNMKMRVVNTRASYNVTSSISGTILTFKIPLVNE